MFPNKNLCSWRENRIWQWLHSLQEIWLKLNILTLQNNIECENVCPEILCISSSAIFPGVSQNWANFLSMDPHWVNTLPVRLFYLLWSEFPRYHIIINFSIIQSRGAEPTCNLGENRELCVRGYIVYNFAIWKIYSNVPGTVHVLPNFVIPVLLQTCWGFNRTAGGPAFVWSGPIV